MTEITIYRRENVVCYDAAGSIRDTRANEALLLPSRRIIRPTKYYHNCVHIEDDVVAIKYYLSNRGVPYIRIYQLKPFKEVASFIGNISPFAVRAILEKLGLSNDDISFAMVWLGLED